MLSLLLRLKKSLAVFSEHTKDNSYKHERKNKNIWGKIETDSVQKLLKSKRNEAATSIKRALLKEFKEQIIIDNVQNDITSDRRAETT